MLPVLLPLRLLRFRPLPLPLRPLLLLPLLLLRRTLLPLPFDLLPLRLLLWLAVVDPRLLLLLFDRLGFLLLLADLERRLLSLCVPWEGNDLLALRLSGGGSRSISSLRDLADFDLLFFFLLSESRSLRLRRLCLLLLLRLRLLGLFLLLRLRNHIYNKMLLMFL